MSRKFSINIDPSSILIVGGLIAAIAVMGGGRSAISNQPASAANVHQTSSEPTRNPSTANLGVRIIRTMTKKNWKIDENFNIVAISGMNLDGTLNQNLPNQWNDVVVVVRPDGTILLIYVATTEPGWSIVQKPIVMPGAAQLRPGQWRAFQIGTHWGKEPHRALVQTGGSVDVVRDVNKNGKRDEPDPVTSGMQGINWHRPLVESPVVGGLSAGCVVARRSADHWRFMSVIEQHPGYRNNRNFVFTGSLLLGTEIE